MSITVLPNGRLRAQVNDPATGRNLSVPKILGLPKSASTWPNTRQGRRDAIKAREQARDLLAHDTENAVTLGAFAERWTTDPLFARPKQSTNLHNAERIKRFVDRHRDLPIRDVTDQTVTEWIKGGSNASTVPSLKAMFNDAATVAGGRLIDRNPFNGVRTAKRSRGHDEPPTERAVWEIIGAARTLTSPAFAAWLQVACFTGLRPGELDALRWDAVDLDTGRLHVREQYNAKTATFTLPKNGQRRQAILTGHARDALLGLAKEGPYCFTTIRGTHFTASARAYHWKAVRAAAGWDKSLYLATRHFFGSYAVNTLGLDSEDVAIAMGHTDGGDLVRSTYGHRNHDMALQRVQRAFSAHTTAHTADQGAPISLRSVG